VGAGVFVQPHWYRHFNRLMRRVQRNPSGLSPSLALSAAVDIDEPFTSTVHRLTMLPIDG
jgi:hypothetical protein